MLTSHPFESGLPHCFPTIQRHSILAQQVMYGMPCASLKYSWGHGLVGMGTNFSLFLFLIGAVHGGPSEERRPRCTVVVRRMSSISSCRKSIPPSILLNDNQLRLWEHVAWAWQGITLGVDQKKATQVRESEAT